MILATTSVKICPKAYLIELSLFQRHTGSLTSGVVAIHAPLPWRTVSAHVRLCEARISIYSTKAKGYPRWPFFMTRYFEGLLCSGCKQALLKTIGRISLVDVAPAMRISSRLARAERIAHDAAARLDCCCHRALLLQD